MFSHKGFHDEKPDVSELVSNSLAQARSLSEQRFNFVKLMEADWRKFANGRREFEESTQATIEALKCHGYSKEANEYAARVYQPEIVSNPGRFTIHWSTGYGLERMTMIFEGREYDDPSLASGETSTSLPEVSSDFLSLAEPVDIEFTPKETLPIEAVWQWICWSTSGFAFCLDCPCGPMAVPSLYITGQAPTHRLIRRVSYLNPFENDNAIKHFRKAHHLDLSIEELLRKYGRQVIAPGLSRWDIAAHNYSIQHVHLRLSHEAERSFASDQVQHPLKTVDELSVAESRATVYQYGGHSWVVLCPDLDCHLGFFETNPFNRGRGFEHFRAHGLRITTNRELAERFGYQVVDSSWSETSDKTCSDTTSPPQQDTERPAHRTAPQAVVPKTRNQLKLKQAMCSNCTLHKVEPDRAGGLCASCRRNGSTFSQYRNKTRPELVELCATRGIGEIKDHQSVHGIALLLSRQDRKVKNG